MDNMTKFGSVYFAVLGIATLAFGIAEFVVMGMYGTEGAAWGPLDISGLFLPWRAIILIGAGLMYLSSVTNFANVRQLAKAVAASVMVWIVAAMSFWGMIAGSIPGGEDGPWFSSPADFLAAYGYPYIPAIFLLPFSLVIIYFILRRRKVSALPG